MLCRPSHFMRLLVLVFALAGWGNILVGATLTVSTAADSGAGSLRQAIAGASAGDTITFSLADHSVITLASPLLINKTLTISGPGAELLTLDGGSGWSTTPTLLPSSGTRIMDITAATVSLSGLRFRNAYVSGAGMAGASTGENGAAIRILGASAVTVDGCWFSNNLAKDRTTDPPVGGAIHLDQGTLTVQNSSFHDNYAGAGSAICNYAGAVSLINCTLSGNTAYSGGAFIHVPGTSVSTLTRCTIADNLSLNSHDSAGVSVIDGSVVLKDCIVSGNSLGQHVTLLTRYADLDPNWNGAGLVVSQGGNILGSNADVAYAPGTRDLVGTLALPADPKLQALDLTLTLGGHTPYRPLSSTSPAIDNGVETGGVDQRGAARIDNVDSGAYEYVPVNISGSAGIAGASLAYTDGTGKTATADPNGLYSLTVPPLWSGSVTPSKAGYTFAPSSITYSALLSDQTSQDFVATPIVYTISGNVGVAGATLAYEDSGSKTATADGSGNYSFTVSYNWSGTVTPAKPGYTFTPANKAYTNVLSNQTSQDFTATAITYTISGNAGIAGASLAYEDGGTKTATADGSGNYALTVSYNWSGTVTPTKAGYTFNPASKTYAGVLSSQTSQSYAATAITYTISGNAGIAGATLAYEDGESKTATADSNGNYNFTVSYNWSGTVTPAKPGYTFTPASKAYTSVLSNQTSQGYAATAITYTISGNVGIAGTTLSYNDGTPKTATSDGSGNYSFTVSYNWSGTVTPAKPGYTFTPANKAYTNVLSDQTSQSYTATAITYTISGNTGIAGATLAYTDGGSKTLTTDASGGFSFTVSYNWNGVLTPSKAGFSFSPTSRSFVNVLSDQVGTSFTATLNAPTSPQASAISGTGFVAGWESNPAATGYLLDVSTSSSFISFLDGFHDLSVTELFATVTDLKPATTYYFRVRAKDSTHTSEYAVSSSIATSAIAPDATTLAADSVAPTSATLNAQVNARNSSTTVTFEYGPTASLGFSITATLSPVTGMSDTQVSAQLSNLAPLTQYYFRVVAENAGGSAAGSLLSFTTPHMPAVLVQAMSPSSAPVGKVITVSGSGFTGATSVVLGGMEAIFTVVSDTELSCIVPPGAITGVIKVSSPAGTGESTAAFTVEMEG